MREAVHGDELWTSDGTDVGTMMVKDINNVGTAGSGIAELTDVGNGNVMFSAVTAATGAEPWVSDGTDPGTFTLGDLQSGTGASYPTQFEPVNGMTVFVTSGTAGKFLWATDGTARYRAASRKLHGDTDWWNDANLQRHQRRRNHRILHAREPELRATVEDRCDGRGHRFHKEIRTNYDVPFPAANFADINGKLYLSPTPPPTALSPGRAMALPAARSWSQTSCPRRRSLRRAIHILQRQGVLFRGGRHARIRVCTRPI